jgi:Zn-dependent peptidase ImmA (M78 family)
MAVRGFKTWCENTAAAFRRQLGRHPYDPLDPRRLADLLGVMVWRADDVPGLESESLGVLVESDPSSWSAVTVHGEKGTVVIVNSAHSEARTASNLTHELAHMILGHEPARVDVAENGLLLLHGFDRSQEDEASWLSGCLLLPRVALLHARGKKWPTSDIAARFGVSVDMVSYRIKVTGVDAHLARRQSR